MAFTNKPSPKWGTKSGSQGRIKAPRKPGSRPAIKGSRIEMKKTRVSKKGRVGGSNRSISVKRSLRSMYRKNVNDIFNSKGEGSALSYMRANKELGDVGVGKGKVSETLGLIDASPELIPSSDDLPSSVKKWTRSIGGINGTWMSHIHKAHVKIGPPMSVGLRALVRNNGLTKARIYDSIFDNIDDATRPQLKMDVGFNRRTVAFVNPGYFGYTPTNARAEWDPSGIYYTSQTETQRTYGAATQIRSKVVMVNNNRALPLKIKCHLVKQKKLEYPFNAVLNTITNADINVQSQGTIPKLRQFTGPGALNWCNVVSLDPNYSGLFSCANAQAAIEVVKTVEFKLSAGDQAEFTYDHLLKSGLPLENLFGAYNSSAVSNLSAVTYGLVLDMVGTYVEGIWKPGELKNRYRGTGPASVSLEFRKEIWGAKSSSPATSMLEPAANFGGFYSTNFACRTYSIANTSAATNKKFNVDYASITTDPASLTGMYIPVATDTAIVPAGDNMP